MQPSRDIARLLEIMAVLRDPVSGCAWDVAQTHETLAPYAVEEAYEVVDAIERADPSDLRDELGDLLLQVVFHARVAEEAGSFSFGDVVETITAKLLRRHPHVFRPPAAETEGRPLQRATPEQVKLSWETIKAAERAARAKPAVGGVLAGVPVALPGLTRAVKLQEKASAVGFDWRDARLVLAAIREEVDEVERELDAPQAKPEALRDEVGDILFAVANLSRHLGLDPETAIRATNRKFERRFAFIEDHLAADRRLANDATLEEMDELWGAAKRAGL